MMASMSGAFCRSARNPDVLLCRETDEHTQPVMCRDIEQLAGRHRVRNAHAVDPGVGHLTEIALDLNHVPVFALPIVGTKRAVGHASDVEFLIALEEELSADRGANEGTIRYGTFKTRWRIEDTLRVCDHVGPEQRGEP